MSQFSAFSIADALKMIPLVSNVVVESNTNEAGFSLLAITPLNSIANVPPSTVQFTSLNSPWRR